jgi:tight adherence protein C
MILPRGDMPVLISVLAFVALYFFSLGVMYYFRHRTKKRALIERVRQDEEPWGDASGTTSASSGGRVVRKTFLDFLGSLGRKVFPKQPMDYSQIRIRFLRAGLRGANVAAIFYGTKSFFAISLPASFFFTRFAVSDLLTPPVTVMICFLLAIIGFYLPDIWLRFRTTRRKEKIIEAVPDALDLLVVCVEAGMGLNAAINRVGEEISLSNKPLSDELKLLGMELRTGKSREDALRNLVKRTDSEDISNLVTLLIQTDRFGTSVARTLRIYADVFRTKRYQKAEEIAAKIPVKLLFPLIFLIFPSLFVVILGPAVIRIMEVFSSR